ncbi:hypothetical protein SPRG_09248 [Saprolegnia parasitica CBS 223.65]|uniref:Ankyrin repeat domain containing protein n=1 Tax=Saprolegnia parasitica (strain CBS 223.65) TaxID=695850 RepID=A0A067CEY4_SAPPC|nr:hypothetical protein SPRG_09248 [Saprolegnia parasitica CBS 223.65]KDO25106.1 hypothetical protein SPRG_09248 [Saprolegnia parasitica CBS 223.65]|eukprot:XP_012204179.1 hypothetical protein SPRG_09248 [Saprolegnia parasitica CBS 223.65]
MGQCYATSSAAIHHLLCCSAPPRHEMPNDVVAASSSVLTNRDLWRSITAFQPGTRFLIKRLVRQWRGQREPAARARLILDAIADPVSRMLFLRELYTSSTRYFSRTFMNLSASYGYHDVLVFLHEHRKNGCTTDAMDLAAANGHVAIVAFLHQHRNEGCTTRAMDVAAANGHLDVVRFLHLFRKEGCTTQAMDLAAANGHLDIVRFLHANRTEGPTMHNASWDTIERMRSWRYCQWTAISSLVTLACDLDDLDDDPLTSTRACSLEMHLVDTSAVGGCTSFAMDWAIANGHADVVAFLADARQLRCTREMHRLALARGHDAVATCIAPLLVA